MASELDLKPQTWYVYLLCDPDTEIPFYVGKGIGDRIEDHERFVDSSWHSMNKEKNSIIRRILGEGKQVLKKIVAEFTSERDAYIYERAMIILYHEHLTNISFVGGGSLTQGKQKPPKNLKTPFMISEEPIGAEEAARMLGVTARTVIKLAERREILGFRVGKLWKFYPSDIREYIDKQRRGSNEPDSGHNPVASP